MDQHEKISYVEFPSRDLEQTKKFFSEAFGWKFQDYGEAYTSFSDAGLNGGFYKSEAVSLTANGATLVVIYSSELEETQAKIQQAGGNIIQEIFEFPGGRRFHFTEPSGGEFAVWSDK
ncbi:VOC family protein [Luteolibacter sp. AS25]|uniref:VOC family protein n=1 Tax=Luteolibacter sp. AS25 TaxID=3135776 RepID=UPI00398A79C2